MYDNPLVKTLQHFQQHLSCKLQMGEIKPHKNLDDCEEKCQENQVFCFFA